jgi:hypothetical protein
VCHLVEGWEELVARKETKLRPVMVRLPEGLRGRLARKAERNARSMNGEIIHRLEGSFEREDRAQLIETTATAVAAKVRTEPRGDPDIGRRYLSNLVREFGSLSDGDPRKIEARKRAVEARRWITETESSLEEMWKEMDEQKDTWDRIMEEDEAEQQEAMGRLIERRLREKEGKS